MADRIPSNDELRAIELLAQLAAISPEGDPTAVRMTLRLGNGPLVGEALLSAKAVEALTDSVISLNQQRADLEEATRPAEPLPEADAGDVEAMLAELHNIVNGGQD